jgi:hypothetical protein
MPSGSHEQLLKALLSSFLSSFLSRSELSSARFVRNSCLFRYLPRSYAHVSDNKCLDPSSAHGCAVSGFKHVVSRREWERCRLRIHCKAQIYTSNIHAAVNLVDWDIASAAFDRPLTESCNDGIIRQAWRGCTLRIHVSFATSEAILLRITEASFARQISLQWRLVDAVLGASAFACRY